MPKKIDDELKARAVRLVNDHRGEYASLTAAAAVVAKQLGVGKESVRRWVRPADVDDGVIEGQTSAEQSELVQLRRQMRRLDWRTRSCAERRPIPPRARSQNELPAGP